jgi:two-component system cell cycle sensor histidine kinase/response regulator CckA
MTQLTVLVVDDHSLVLTTLVKTLARAGFKVLSAASGEEALEIASNMHFRIDLLVCDVILPGMQGTELAQRFEDIHPETRCLFISGLPDHPRTYHDVAASGQALLPKPFLPQALIRKAREVLAAELCVLAAVI